jgi:hypothetical protein
MGKNTQVFLRGEEHPTVWQGGEDGADESARGSGSER